MICGNRASRLLLASMALTIVISKPVWAIEFELADSIETIEAPRKLALADMNGDGLLDIVAQHDNLWPGSPFENRLTVMLATGDGSSFLPPVATSTPMLKDGNLVVFDADEDGNLDVVTASFSNNELLLFAGDGSGGFDAAETIPLSDDAVWLSSADFDGDGHQDIVYSGNFGVLGLLPGDGKGGFGPAVALGPVGFIGGPTAIGDLDGDGLPDLAMSSESGGSLAVLINDGTGIPANPQILSVDAANLSGVAIGDVDGDGLADIVVSGTGSNTIELRPQQQGLWTLINQGSASFAAPVVDEMFDARDIELADFDGDGFPDVAGHVVESNAVAVKLNDGQGGWQRRRDWNTTRFPTDLAIGDLDGDGLPDIVAPASAQQPVGDIALLLNEGGGAFAAREDYRMPGESRFMVIEEIDGDTIADIVAGLVQIGPNALGTLPGEGGTGFLPAVLSDPLGSFGSYRPGPIAAAHFDTDGHLDVVTALDGSPNAAMVIPGTAGGAFDVDSHVLLATTGRPQGVAVGDFNNDGRTDVAVPNSSIGNIDLSVFFNLGGGNWGDEERYATQGVPIYPVVGDLDGDGWLDVVVGNQVGNELSIFRNDEGQFILETVDLGGRQWHLQLIDFNDDGALDLLLGLEQNGAGGPSEARAAILLNDGDGNFSAPLLQSSTDTLAVRAGDLDGDGHLDLVGIGGRSLFTIYPGLGNAQFEAPTTWRGAAGDGSGALRIVDLDHDGTPEVLSIRSYSVSVYTQEGVIIDGLFSDRFEQP
ncbi:MAG: hypothetical protein GVY32_02260 [Gammaproteobacteria bacterium]|jgi:hypothetical protein|nr:hypothetical protein [Gammaproteobacteria bacterium]